MFAGHAEGAALVNLTEKGAGTDIAVFNPEVAGLNRVQDGPEQRAFLRMAIFAWKDISDHTQGRFIDDQRCAGPGTSRGFTQFFHAMLTGFEAVTIDDFSSIARKPRGAFTAHVLDERSELASAVAYQLSRGRRLSALKFAID